MLALIKGNNKPLPIVECPKCGGVSFIEVRHTKHRTGKKVSKGVKAEACITCLINGELMMI